jgi:hypothetical protein
VSIDWAATGAMLSGLGAIGGAVAIVWAAVLGKAALDDFHQQKLVEQRIRIAEETLIAASRAFDAVAQMQGRWIPAFETDDAEKALQDAGVKVAELEETIRGAVVTRTVIYRRAEFFKADFDCVFAAIPKAKVHFGQDVADLLKEFVKARNRLLSAADMMPMAARAGDHDRDFAVEIRRTVFGSLPNEPDEIREIVANAMGRLELKLAPILAPRKVTSGV